MGLLSQDAKDAFANRQANAGSGSSRYLKTSELSEDGTRITFLGDESHSIRGYGTFLDRKGGGKMVKINTPEKLSLPELKERANELGAVEPTQEQREFYAFTIYNYDAEAIQIFEFNQSGLITGIVEFITDEDVEGNEEEYDMKLVRTKTGKDPRDVRYTATPLASGKRKQASVKKKIEKAFDELIDSGYDISELFNPDGDPFKPAVS